MSDRYDLVVLGGGTAGLVSSVIAASVGARVCLVERERTGGDCLWTGCVPSKSLIAAATLAHSIRTAGAVGLEPTEPRIDFASVMNRVHDAIATIEPHDSPERLRREGVEVIEGEARLTGEGTVAVDGRTLRFRSAIVATGSEPIKPELPGLDGESTWNTETIWELRELPRKLVVLGGGPVACELGQAFRRLGAEVTLLQRAERLLEKEEPEASALVLEVLRSEGVDVRLEARAREVRRREGSAELVLANGIRGEEAVAFDHLLLAAGRRPRTDGLGLDAAGVRVGGRGEIEVDERLRTSADRIFAAGDVTGRLPFTHVAAHHARVAVANALFGARRKVDETIPWVTFTRPEVARVGMSSAQARERWGERATLARSDYSQLDRAITEGEAHGFALLVGDPRGRLVGATVAAPGAGEAIAELTARVKHSDKIASLSETVHAYPTLAEGPSRAADDHLRERLARYRGLARAAVMLRRLVRR